MTVVNWKNGKWEQLKGLIIQISDQDKLENQEIQEKTLEIVRDAQ